MRMIGDIIALVLAPPLPKELRRGSAKYIHGGLLLAFGSLLEMSTAWGSADGLPWFLTAGCCLVAGIGTYRYGLMRARTARLIWSGRPTWLQQAELAKWLKDARLLRTLSSMEPAAETGSFDADFDQRCQLEGFLSTLVEMEDRLAQSARTHLRSLSPRLIWSERQRNYREEFIASAWLQDEYSVTYLKAMKIALDKVQAMPPQYYMWKPAHAPAPPPCAVAAPAAAS